MAEAPPAMLLDDTQGCPGARLVVSNRVAGICCACDRRGIPFPVLAPAAQRGPDGQWRCANRRFGGASADAG